MLKSTNGMKAKHGKTTNLSARGASATPWSPTDKALRRCHREDLAVLRANLRAGKLGILQDRMMAIG